MPDLRLMDVMLFDYGTTNRTDFRYGEIKPIVRTVYTEKPGCLRIRPPPLKDIHTLSDRKNLVPFDLLVKPKEIVRTNPKQIQEKYVSHDCNKSLPTTTTTLSASKEVLLSIPSTSKGVQSALSSTSKEVHPAILSTSKQIKSPGPSTSSQITLQDLIKLTEKTHVGYGFPRNALGGTKHKEDPPDLGKDEAVKTRPRLVMTPAVSLDDIIEPQSRKQLIENVYKSTIQEANSDVASTSNNLKAPFPGLPAPANPITLEKLNFPYVSPEWRMQSAGWDVAQLRGHCDPSREFYLTRAPQCEACKVTAAVIAQRKLMKEIKKR